MSTLPRVLVLLATRNGVAVLERQLRSVLQQSDVNVCIDVRDDASTDGTRQLVQSLSSQDSRVNLHADHRASGSASGNFFRLIAAAKLDGVTHVSLCDQDDEWRVDKLTRAIMSMQATNSAGYSSAVLAAWPDGRSRLLVQDPRERCADYLFEGAGQGCTFVFTVALFRRLQSDLAANSGLLPKLHYHDWTLYALARGAGERWHFDDWPSMIYYQHGGNDTGARSSIAGVMRRVALIRQGWYRAQVDAIVQILLAARPFHTPSVEWMQLAGSRRARLLYVMRHGRRRLVDRAILAAAVVFGYL